MRAFVLLLLRELQATFCSFGYYMLLAIVFALTAWAYQGALEAYGFEMTLALLGISQWPFFITMFVAPLLTMRLFAEEKRSGSIELLMTAPVNDLQVVAAKYVGAAIVYFTFVSPIWLLHVVLAGFFGAEPDWGLLVAVTTGLLGVGTLFLAVGTLTSALTSMQLWAALLAFLGNIVFWLGGNVWRLLDPGSKLRGALEYVSLNTFIDTTASGIVDLRQVVLVMSLTVLVLFLTVRVVEVRRWR